MKKIYTLLSGIIVVLSNGYSQSTIPNQSFENWEQIVVKDSLEYWNTSTQNYQALAIDIDNSHQVGNAQDGNFAFRVETQFNTNGSQVDSLLGYAVINNIDNGLGGFSYSDTVDVLNGWYKCNNINNDSCMAIVQLMKNGVPYSSVFYPFSGVVSTWTQFSIPLPNGNIVNPDSVFIGFTSSYVNDETVYEEGNWLEVDNISFGFNSGTTTPSPIPNYSFENMIHESIEQAENWWSLDPIVYNIFQTLYSTKSTDATDGNSSLRIETTQAIDDLGIIAIVTNGEYDINTGLFIGGVPFTAQPDTYSFKYKYTPSGGDNAFALVNFLSNGVTMGIDTINQIATSNTWATYTQNLTFTQAPDSVRIAFFSGSNVGSVLLIDDIQFLGGDVSVDEITISNDWTIYPNPANNQLTLKNMKNTTLAIFDMSGKNIYKSQNNSNMTTIETSNWNNGVR